VSLPHRSQGGRAGRAGPSDARVSRSRSRAGKAVGSIERASASCSWRPPAVLIRGERLVGAAPARTDSSCTWKASSRPRSGRVAGAGDARAPAARGRFREELWDGERGARPSRGDQGWADAASSLPFEEQDRTLLRAAERLRSAWDLRAERRRAPGFSLSLTRHDAEVLSLRRGARTRTSRTRTSS